MTNFTTPVLLIVFNRSDTTQQLIKTLQTIRPSHLYVFADGPRSDDEKQQVEQVRQLFASLPWQCQLHTNFQSKNLGCGLGPATAMDWFFAQVEQGIILEDDILPSIQFFEFTQHILEKYADDKSIGSIGAYHSLSSLPISGDYTFSRYTYTWGWATWRDRWQQYRHRLTKHDEDEVFGSLQKQAMSWQEKIFWQLIVWQLRSGLLPDVWDYQWTLTHFKKNWQALIPRSSLVTNIGVSHPLATHRSLLQSTKVPQESERQTVFLTAAEYSPQLDRQLFFSVHSWWKEMMMMGRRIIKKLSS